MPRRRLAPLRLVGGRVRAGNADLRGQLPVTGTPSLPNLAQGGGSVAFAWTEAGGIRLRVARDLLCN